MTNEILYATITDFVPRVFEKDEHVCTADTVVRGDDKIVYAQCSCGQRVYS